MRDFLLKIPDNKDEIYFVIVKFKNVNDADNILNDTTLLQSYLEKYSNHKLRPDLIDVIGDVEVKVQCPDKVAAEEFMNSMNSLDADKRFDVSIERTKSLLENVMDSMRTTYNQLLEGHQVKIFNLQEKLINLSSKERKKFLSIAEFEKKKQVQDIYEEKIFELEKQKLEFEITYKHITESLDYYKNNEKKESEEIIRLEKLFDREKNRFKAILPIYAHKSQIIESVVENQVVVLVGETGSGKTTQIIQYLYDFWCPSDKIMVCTQPRKVAATSVAMRVAEELNINVGGLVGYKVGFDCKMSQDTKLLFLTDHVLLNECQFDKDFSEYSCIILDEAHERSIYTDLLLGFIKQCLARRPDLKLLVTSATINPDVFVDFFKDFHPPVLRVSGRVFPVETFYEASVVNDDYLTSAVDKAASLHHSETLHGDVLVFLTSPAETELAVRKLSKMELKDCLVLPLHGQLQVSQQREVLLPMKPNMRKIIFATNAAETSITIPGICHVIDPGYVKESVFDSSKNMTSLVVKRTTQSSADQRKGRAGRTESGKCYRLYKEEEFEKMRPNSVPEIMRIHLGQSMLKLMMLGMSDPKEFDFVEAPPFESIQAAFNLLKEIGAIDDFGITEIGIKIAALNLEPRMGKFTLTCMDDGLIYEGIVICALSCFGNQIFFRGGSDEQKFQSDLRKTPFCDDYGDLITLLNVYKVWSNLPKYSRVNWCLDHSINSKRIQGASELIDEIIHSFQNQLGIAVEKCFSKGTDVSERLAKTIFKCFVSNLARYTGHRKIGFRVMTDQELSIHIHPSSSLTYLEQFPSWVVYHSLLTIGQRYMLNVIYVKNDWVMEAMAQGELGFTQDDVDAASLEMKELPNIGSKLQKLLFSKDSLWNKSIIEAKICSKDPRIQALLDLENVPRVFLYASSLFLNDSYNTALEEIQQMRENISKEVLVRPITTLSPMRFAMTRGMKIVALLMRNEFLEIEVNDSELQDHVKRYESKGKVEFIKVSKDENKWIVTFNDWIHAQKFRRRHGGGVIKNYGMMSEVKSTLYFVNVSMIRRVANSTSFIEFHKEMDRSDFLFDNHKLEINYSLLKLMASRTNRTTVVVQQTPEWATNEMIFDALSTMVSCSKISYVRVIRKPPPNQAVSEYQKDLLRDHILNRLDIYPSTYTLTINEPRPNDYTLNAILTFEDSQDIVDAIRRLNDINLLITAKLNLKLKFYTPPNIYKALMKEIEDKFIEIETQLKKIEKSVKEPSNKNTCFFTTIETETIKDYDYVKEEMTPFLSGLPWKVEFFETLLNFRNEILNVAIDQKTGITFDARQKCIVIYGSRFNINSMKEHLKKFTLLRSPYASKEISLRNREYPKGLMKQVILNYGCDVENSLRTVCKAESVKIILKRHVIRIKGPDESYDQLIQILKDLAFLIGDKEEILDNDPNKIGDCPICLSDVQKDNHFASESCGHIYCKSCAKQLIKNNIEQSVVPMTCVVEGCDQPLMIHDVQTLISSQSEFDKIMQIALKDLQLRNSDRYRFCPTPDCITVFPLKVASLFITDSSREENDFICSECGLMLCRLCGIKGHLSLDCTSLDRDFTKKERKELNDWLNEDPTIRSTCPRCSTGIEKNGGCNHMTCFACKIHICWVCKMTFRSSGECYSHMGSAHRTFV